MKAGRSCVGAPRSATSRRPSVARFARRVGIQCRHSDPGMQRIVTAVDYLRANSFRGNLMTYFDVGAYVSCELYPTAGAGVDSWYEAAYRPGALKENVALHPGPDSWRGTLARYPTDPVLSRNAAPGHPTSPARPGGPWSTATTQSPRRNLRGRAGHCGGTAPFRGPLRRSDCSRFP